MRAHSYRPFWNAYLADAAAAHLHPQAEVLAPHTEPQLRALAQPYAQLARVDHSGQRAAAPYLDALRWSLEVRQLSAPGGAASLDALGRRFMALMGRLPACTPALGDAHTRRLRAMVLGLRLFECLGTRHVKKVLTELLCHEALVQPEPGETTLVDVQSMALSAWTLAWRRLLGTSPLYDLLLQVQSHTAVLPPAARAQLLAEECVLVCTFDLHERLRVVSERLAACADTHPGLQPLRAHTQQTVAFLQGAPLTEVEIDALLDHLLREESLWSAADTLLLLHMAHRFVPLEGPDLSALGGDDALALHFGRLHNVGLAAIEQGWQPPPGQARRVQAAAVSLLRHLASLVPAGEPAGVPLLVALLPHALRRAASAQLCPHERRSLGLAEQPDAGV